MTFYEIIDKYYLNTQKGEILELLNEISILDNIEYAINEYFIEIENKNKAEISSILTITIIDFVTAINKNKINIKSDYFNKEKKLIQLGVYFIKETFDTSKLSDNDYFSLLKQTLKIVYKKHGWDFKALNDLLNFDNLQYFSQNKVKEIKTSKPIYLVWNSKINIDFFISDIVTEFKGIKNKKSIYKLFDIIDEDFKIILNSKHLELFLSLFFILHQCNIIAAKGNRGIFKYLENHIIPANNENFPKMNFRKIRYNAFLYKKDEIFNKLKPITEKYCVN